MTSDSDIEDQEIQKEYRDDEKLNPDTREKFLTTLVEPNSPYKHIKRDWGLTKLTAEEVAFCLFTLKLARTVREMTEDCLAFNSEVKDKEHIGEAIANELNKYYINQIEEVDEITNVKRSEKGFQWEALNKQIREVRKKELKKKKARMFGGAEDQEDEYE